MISLSTLVAFVLASFVIIVIPGPSVLFVIGRSLTLGRRAGLLSVLGNEAGVVPVVFAVALGVGAIVEASIVLFTIIKVAGACYLAYLGIQAIRHRKDNLAKATEAKPRSACDRDRCSVSKAFRGSRCLERDRGRRAARRDRDIP